MKRGTLVLVIITFLAGCGQSTQKTGTVAEITADANFVTVFYFHGKARCKTCVAVGDVARETVKETFADNDKVRFVEINTSEKGNDALIEKYEITWNALIIAKGDDFVEITQQAFSTAVNNPQSLENLIKNEVNNRLQ